MITPQFVNVALSIIVNFATPGPHFIHRWEDIAVIKTLQDLFVEAGGNLEAVPQRNKVSFVSPLDGLESSLLVNQSVECIKHRMP